MQKHWKLLIDSYTENTKNFSNHSFHFKNGVHILNSGTQEVSNNIAIINDEYFDAKFIKEKLVIPGIIYSQSYNVSVDLLEVFTDKLNYLGQFPIMQRTETDLYYSAPHYDNIKIENSHYSEKVIKDFNNFLLEKKEIKEELIKNYDKENIHIFMCYMNDKPIAFLYAISFGEDAFILEVSVKEGHRNSGILTILSKYAKEYAVNHGIYNFYSIATSEYTVHSIQDQGHKMVDSLHIWSVSQWYN